jgi:signal transduction histidine kinase
MFSDDKFAAHQSVLIVAQSPAFAQALIERWQQTAPSPAFTVLAGGDHSTQNGGHHNAYHLVIVEGAALQSLRSMLQRLYVVGTPMLCALPLSATSDSRPSKSSPEPIFAAPSPDQIRADFPRMLSLSLADRDSGLDTLVTVAMEVLKRVEVSLRLKKTESEAGAQSAQLALGKYVAESIHGFNNALTAVLGNAELLMLDAANFSPDVREEIEAIHSNAIRLHEMMQRFSSLEAEFQAGRKQGKGEAAAAGTQAYLSGT